MPSRTRSLRRSRDPGRSCTSPLQHTLLPQRGIHCKSVARAHAFGPCVQRAPPGPRSVWMGTLLRLRGCPGQCYRFHSAAISGPSCCCSSALPPLRGAKTSSPATHAQPELDIPKLHTPSRDCHALQWQLGEGGGSLDVSCDGGFGLYVSMARVDVHRFDTHINPSAT